MKYRSQIRVGPSRPTIVRFAIATLVLVAAFPPAAPGDVKLPSIFADHMVLQQNAVDPVWGWAAPGETVTVTIADQQQHAVADSQGKWKLELSNLKPGTPQALTIEGKNKIVINDVLVGEVWLCSGQSNMDLRVKDARDAAKEIAGADYPQVRCYTVAKVTAQTTPMDDVKGTWAVCTPATVGDFTAVGYFFARDLYESLKTPVAIIHSSVGATNAEAWTSSEGLAVDPGLKEMRDAELVKVKAYPEAAKQFVAAMADWESKYSHDTGNQGEPQGWAKPDFDDSDWKTTTVPTNFLKLGFRNGGAVWFRKTLDVPATEANKDVTLQIGGGTDDKTVYFNGTKLEAPHRDSWFFSHNDFVHLPGSLVHPGRNTIALRIYALRYDGGISPFQDRLGMAIPGLEAGPDITTWRYHLEYANPPLSPEANAAYPAPPKPAAAPTFLYNGMIHPLIPYAIKGAIWYQGETQHRGYQYRTLLPALIRDWRAHWNSVEPAQGDFPFYIVQLPNYWPVRPQPGASGWAEIREAESLAAANVPNTYLVVTIDLGETGNVHPKNKQPVGQRLALSTLVNTYGQKLEASGPLYQSMAIEGSSIRLKFAHADGMQAKGGGPLKQFAIAGEDQKFVWADAKIDGDTIVVSSPQITKPLAVRYAWADNPEGANLYNASDLPASPFRTDDWPESSRNDK